MQLVKRDVVSGAPKQAFPVLRQRLMALADETEYYIRIGITGDIEQRKGVYERYDDYDIMEIIYRTRSADYVRQLEAHLVHAVWYDCDNEISGGGGPLARKGPPYYLYVVYYNDEARAA